MFIKVHSVLKKSFEKPIIINTNIIGYSCEEHDEDGNKFTIIYSDDKLVWHVKESLDEIIKLMKEAI